ncbi:uncharacterized protein LOC129756300 [Uranotaenia lowii]|uniref:uncharacterized protein LOC129756300 n=1 Tax=Uranotaenia lowii TaxID=190385 RepID=UPI0024786D69|nr:uncharacterized protein LOC129756300 [Uranotaenia lowii]
MPAFAEMLVSQSPPVYSHSLVDYISSQTDHSEAPYAFNGGPKATSTLSSFCRPASLKLTPPPLRRQPTPANLAAMPASPRRSCLVVRPEDLSPEEERPLIELDSPTDVSDKNRLSSKKKVVFADDQGGQLTQVRVMREPSYMPPIWSLQFLAHVTQGLISPVPQEQWIVDFRQPASAYLEFRAKVDEHNVSLENVIIKETEHLIVGTVKVKNVSYHKQVIVRSSCDGWKTHEDTYCTYTLVGSGAASAYTLYDTFSFKLTLPPKSRRIEFCVCFKCDIGEFWDNNDGHNYSLTNRVMPRQDSSIFFTAHNAFSSSNNASRNNLSTNGDQSSATNNDTNNNSTATSLSDYSSPFVDPAAELDTWRHMSTETHSGPYCLDLQESPYDSLEPPSFTRSSSSDEVTDDMQKHLETGSPKLSRRRYSEQPSPFDEDFCFKSRPQNIPNRRASLPRQEYNIRERKETDDLLVNLLNLRKLMLGQQNMRI